MFLSVPSPLAWRTSVERLPKIGLLHSVSQQRCEGVAVLSPCHVRHRIRSVKFFDPSFYSNLFDSAQQISVGRVREIGGEEAE